jgi:(E)-4-hydroxy-3-methyl-but-2-enyl pyrophosphate reductase
MKVRIADSAGFCMGVRKAMDSVIEASRGSTSTYTLGPLIHNPHALKMLENRGVEVVEDIDERLVGHTVVIRAHGVPEESKQRLENIGATVVDATCPKVLRSEHIIREKHADDYDIVIVGDRGHAEIEALLSYAGDGVVVETLDEARKLPEYQNICVVAQTTFNRERYSEIADEICTHAAEDCHVANTVCASTDRRQADVRKLAAETDATVVVGGLNSANTARLAEISRELGQPTFLVEDPGELDLEALTGYEVIGLTAGASTPNWLIKQVYDTIAGYTPGTHRTVAGWARSLAFFAIEGNVVVCAAAAALTFAVARLMGIAATPLYVAMSFFYLFPLHTVNRYFELNWRQIGTTRQAPLLRRYWTIYLVMSLVAGIIALSLAWYMGPLAFVLVATTYLLGGMYSVRILPAGWHTRFKSLRDIPGSKDIVIALGWTFVMVTIPRISMGEYPLPVDLVAAGYVFILVLTRTSLLAIQGIQSDRLIGLETIPVLISRKNSLRLLYTANGLLLTFIGVLTAIGALRPSALALIIGPAYLIGCVRMLSRKDMFFTLYHQLVPDAGFFLAGLAGYLFL